jgi:hypothetical protein
MIMYDSLHGADKISLAGAGVSIPIATGGIIPSNNSGVPIGMVRLNPAAAVTGVILGQGLFNGQIIALVNEAIAANTITPAAAGTSFIADGATAIAGLTGRLLVWDASAALWFRLA